MTHAISQPDSLYGRAKKMEVAVRELVVEYKDYIDVLAEYEVHLDTKVATLGKLADELAGIRPDPDQVAYDLLVDDEVPF